MIGPVPYIGGKRRLARRIIEMLPPHVTYVEPFAGGAQVFFHKPPSRVEVLNDLDGEIVNFFRVCKFHASELTRCLRFLPASRMIFQQVTSQAPSELTDVQRAARFFYLQKNSFGGNRLRRNFHVCVAKPSNFSPARIRATLTATARRLERVQIECLPYEQVLERYDRPDTFFYIDPPYVTARLYQFNFDESEFVELAARLGELKGRFLLSINDHPLARLAFRAFEVREVRISYTASPIVPSATELLFSNFQVPHP